MTTTKTIVEGNGWRSQKENPEETVWSSCQFVVVEREQKTDDFPGGTEVKSQRDGIWVGGRWLAMDSVRLFGRALVSREGIRKRCPREVHLLTEEMQIMIS